MKYCKNCGVKILDPTDRCPFCRCVVTETGETDKDTVEMRNEDSANGENSTGGMYPDARVATRKFRLLESIFLFVSVVAAAGLLIADYMYSHFEYWNKLTAWSFVVILILIYVNVTLRLSFTGRLGYRFKVMTLTILAVTFLILIDNLTGFRGWSTNFILPAAVMFLDLVAAILMLINRRNWQSYMMTQIFEISVATVLLIAAIVGWIEYPNVVVIAFAVSVIVFVGTLIFGGTRARNELKRRFYI